MEGVAAFVQHLVMVKVGVVPQHGLGDRVVEIRDLRHAVMITLDDGGSTVVAADNEHAPMRTIEMVSAAFCRSYLEVDRLFNIGARRNVDEDPVAEEGRIQCDECMVLGVGVAPEMRLDEGGESLQRLGQPADNHASRMSLFLDRVAARTSLKRPTKQRRQRCETPFFIMRRGKAELGEARDSRLAQSL